MPPGAFTPADTGHSASSLGLCLREVLTRSQGGVLRVSVMSECPGSPSCPRVRLPSVQPSPAPRLAPWPPSWQPGAGRAGGLAAMSPPSWAPARALPSGLLPLRAHYLIGKPFRKGAEPLGAQGRGAFQGPSWQLPVPDEGRRHASGVCLLSDRWEGSWLLSPFRGDQAGLEWPAAWHCPQQAGYQAGRGFISRAGAEWLDQRGSQGK